MIQIVIGALGTISKGLVKGLEDLETRRQVETVQTTTLLRSDRILRRVQENGGDFCPSNSSQRLSANAGVKISQEAIIIIIIETNCSCSTWNSPQRLGKRLEEFEIIGRIETTKTTVLLRSVRILRKFLEIWEDLLSFQ